MAGLQGLGPAGPFPEGSQKRWFSHEDGHFRYLSMPSYRDQLIEIGTPEHVARDLVHRLTNCGAREVVWAHGQGGRRGHIRASWDVRVISTATPAADVLRDVVGILQDPLGSEPIAALRDAPDVVTAYSQHVPEHKLKLPSRFGPKWSRPLHLPAQLQSHVTRTAYIAMAEQGIGATVVVSAERLPAAEHGARMLLEVIRGDLLGEHGPGDDEGGGVLQPV